MKHVLFVILTLLVLPFHGLGQTYNKLIEPNKNWQVLTWGTQVCDIDHGLEYFFNGDTILNGITYNKVYAYIITPLNGSSTFCPPVGVNRSYSYLEDWYMREDTIARKVFATNSISSNEWLVLDFSLNVGDTILNNSTINCSPNYLIIDSIEPYSLLNGVITKIFYLNDGSSYIEGIGNGKGLYGGFCLPNNDITSCVKVNNTQLFSDNIFSLFGCMGTVGVSNSYSKNIQMINENNFLYFKNISARFQNTSYSIFNELGALVKKGYMTDENGISVKELNNGIYFIEIVDTDKLLFSKRFPVIQD